MHYGLKITKALLAAILLMGVGDRIASSDLVASPATDPVLDLSTQHCERYPEPVKCYATHRQTPQQNQGWWKCYYTLCDAAADGAYQCKKMTDRTYCEVEPS